MFVAALSPRFLGAQRPAVVRMSAAELTQASSMRVKALKEELDERGVAWRGVAFEKDELVRLLEDARANPAPPSTAPSTPPPSPAAPAPSPPPPAADASKLEEADRTEIGAMKVSAIKQELSDLRQPTSGLFEKSEYVEALVAARRKAREEPQVDVDVVEGQTKKMPKKGGEGGGMPGGMGGMGGMPGGMGGMGGMPGGMGGMPGGMGGMEDILKNMGGMGGMPGGMGGMPGGMGGMEDILKNMGGMGGMPGGAAGGAPGGMGGMGDMLGKMMSNPKAMALMQKAQSNPKIMKALQDVQANGPSAMQKYQNDPEGESRAARTQRSGEPCCTHTHTHTLLTIREYFSLPRQSWLLSRSCKRSWAKRSALARGRTRTFASPRLYSSTGPVCRAVELCRVGGGSSRPVSWLLL